MIINVRISKRHIVYAWIVLSCFIAGQWAVYAHYHKVSRITSHTSSNSRHQTIADKCQLCDAMHHNNMDQDSAILTSRIVAAPYFYAPCNYDFISAELVHSSGRAPPLS